MIKVIDLTNRIPNEESYKYIKDPINDFIGSELDIVLRSKWDRKLADDHPSDGSHGMLIFVLGYNECQELVRKEKLSDFDNSFLALLLADAAVGTDLGGLSVEQWRLNVIESMLRSNKTDLWVAPVRRWFPEL